MGQTQIAKFLLQGLLDLQAREGRKLTIGEYAEYLGVSRATLDKWMNGQRTPGRENAVALADKLGPEIYGLLGMAAPDEDSREIARIINSLSPAGRREALERIRELARQDADVSR